MKLLMALFFMILSTSAIGQSDMAMASEAYGRGDFLLAKSYLKKVGDEAPWPLVEFNLGNCEFRLGNMDLAIWHYQRARLDPRGIGLVKNNLAMAQQRLGIQSGRAEEVSDIRDLLDALAMEFPLVLFLILETLFLVGLVWCRKRGLLFFVLLFALLTNVVLSFLHWSHSQNSLKRHAVVLQPGATVRRSPDRQSVILKKLEPGTLAQWSVGSERWVRVDLGDQFGWVERRSLKFVEAN